MERVNYEVDWAAAAECTHTRRRRWSQRSLQISELAVPLLSIHVKLCAEKARLLGTNTSFRPEDAQKMMQRLPALQLERGQFEVIFSLSSRSHEVVPPRVTCSYFSTVPKVTYLWKLLNSFPTYTSFLLVKFRLWFDTFLSFNPSPKHHDLA